MKLSSILLSAIALVVVCGDEDFGFDVSEDFEVELDGNSRKIWSNKEVSAMVGRVFHFVIPADAFDGAAESFEAKRSDGSPLPLWMLFDKMGGIFWGVPLHDDLGPLNLIIRGHGSNKTSELTINILERSEHRDKCLDSEDSTVLTLLIDRGVRAIKPKQRVVAINNIAQFFGLPYSAFSLKPELGKDDITDSSVVLAGPGNLKSRSSKSTSLLQAPVGCDGRLWQQTVSIVHQLKQQAYDGTITEVLGLPLIGWRVKTEARPIVRAKRQLDDYGSGDYDDYYDDYNNNYDDEEYAEEDLEGDSTTSKPIASTKPSHPHRHHHGEVITSDDLGASTTLEPKVETETMPVETTSTTTTTTTTEPSTTTIQKVDITSAKTDPNYEYDYDYDSEDNEEDPVESKTEVPILQSPKQEPSTTTEVVTTTTSTTTTTRTTTTAPPPTSTERETTTLLIVEDEEPSTVVYESSETVSVSVPSTTTPEVPTTITITSTSPVTIEEVQTTQTEIEEDNTSVKSTTTRQVSSQGTTTTTENVEYEAKNFQPYIENRLKQMSVIAGKIFRFVIPNNTFHDLEDGYNLTLEFLNAKGEPLPEDSWCYFNPIRREIYGLPLEEDVSKWDYIIRATDRDGATVTDSVSIQVQQHKLQRVVNHEFSLYMRIEKKQEFGNFVDWSLKTLRALGRIYNSNMAEITVRRVSTVSEPVIFTWTNDSVATNECPVKEIDDLYKMLTANDRGDPSEKLSTLLAPYLRVKKVTKEGLGVCETPQVVVTPPTNFRPFLRNPVDHINATIGELLIFKVPDDTFYDPEDTDGRSLNISLFTGDRQALKPNHWLQFDSKNREFYGIPRKAGRSEYQLICVDNGGYSATDVLEVVVYPAPKVVYNVEFSMTIETPFETFVNSAALQRKFLENLQNIFGDRNGSLIHTNPFRQKQDSTIVTWFNKSLSTEVCPQEEINRLEAILKNHDRSISSRVVVLMDPEFPVSTIKVLAMGNCKVVKPYIPVIPIEDPKVADKSPEANSDQYQYLMTFIVPAVIIAIMLLAAGLAACILYRRRRTGKMNVEEDGRQSYGNKGIPVIFQEELEEKPESGTKTPVILKDEKPPLAPPEYSKSGSLKLTDDSEPYQPPPPFARNQDNGRQARPKPTPTYRKPPPYVPP